MSRPLRRSTAHQKGLWTERTKLTGIKNGSPMVQAIADSLQMMRPAPQHRPEDLSAAFEYSCQQYLPQYVISLPDHYAARIRDAFDGDKPDCTSERLPASVTTIRLLDDTELKELLPGPCAPFVLGSSAEISKDVWAAGCLYWASLFIQVSHLGETIIQDSPCVIVDPVRQV
jgi:hypothetical protein